MNRIFKVLWNAATGTFVVTSETAKSRGKKNGRRKLAVSALIGLSSIMVSADALANAGNDTGDGVTPTGTQTGGKGWIAIGTDATANTYTNVDGASAAMGYKASAMGKWSTAIGSYSQSTGDSSLALGVKSVSAGDRAIAMGASSSASGSYSMAMGVYANSSGAKSVALGYKSVASGATSSALGYQATASGDDSAAFGNGAKAVGTNSVALGSGSIAQEDNSVAVGNSTTQRQITYVAKGDINSTSTDAVTGAQIYSLSQSVADRLGGGALSEDSTDAVNGSQLYETNQKVDQNTSAIADINTSITNLGTDALSWDDEEGAFSASHGTSGTNKITNVAAGEIASDSTDAVNGSQLYETNMLISQYNESISQLAGDTSETYITENGTGVKYIRTNDNGLEGQDAYATGNGATAVGYDAVASGAGSLALGQNSSSSIEGSIALGSGSTSNRAITTGIRETSATSDGVVIGYNTTDRELLGALSLGTDGESYRQITNVADGSEAQDAVTVRQLQNAIGAVTTTPTKYYHANSTEEDSLAVGTDSLAMGAKTIVNADAGIGIGLNTLVMADAINGIAIGSNARANHANSIAMGNGSQTTRGAQTDYTAYNMDTPQNSVGEFSVGSEDGQRQITNVAAGSADTDAVNVSQLKVTDAQVSRNTQSITNLNTQVSNLDTRVTNIENGIGDIVTTGSTKYFKTNTDGADANAQGADSVAIGSGSIAAAENSVALGTNSVADEANTVSVGSSTQQRRITNVAAGVNNTDAVNVAQLKASEAGSVRYETNADGSVNYSVLNLGDGSGGTTRIGNVSAAVNDTDAVNYAQLKRSVEEANTYTDQKMGEMNSKIKGVENKMSGGIASAMAMAGLPQAYAPGANMTSIAGGTFNGESAVAIGVSMVSESGGWVYKLQGTSNSQGDYSAAIGAGFQW
ncbi:YadA-like family protein [Salmonella enterica subsp. enterica serovar Canada]|nr:YadA-like family protein [Salmonella enterica subsp. enterica serovar Canada]